MDAAASIALMVAICIEWAVPTAMMIVFWATGGEERASRGVVLTCVRDETGCWLTFSSAGEDGRNGGKTVKDTSDTLCWTIHVGI